MIFSEWLQDIDAAAREQRGVNLERRILGRCADQADVAFFHVWQEGVLLSLVEAVNFVDEDDGTRAVLTRAFGIGHDLLDLFDSGEHGGKFNELRFRHIRDNLRQCGFAGAGWSPEDERARLVAINLRTQRFAGTDEMFLTGELIKCAGPHAVGKGTGAVSSARSVRDRFEKSHNKLLALSLWLLAKSQELMAKS